MPNQQWPFVSSNSSLLDLGDQSPSGPNGFDFGLSQPSTGLGYGLLGDVRSLAAGQNCADCSTEAPCPSCGDGYDPPSASDGQVIKTQFPMPAPGTLLPPILPPTTAPSAHPPIIGDPNAWWNWGDADAKDWLRGVFEARRPPSKAVEQACDAQLDAALKDCEAIARRTTAEAGPDRGLRELVSCKAHERMRYAECLHNNGQSKSPPYADWYGDDD